MKELQELSERNWREIKRQSLIEIPVDISRGGDIDGDLVIASGATEVIRLNNVNNVGTGPDILFDQSALIAAEESIVFCIDSDNDSTGAIFQLKKDADTTSATEIMTIDEGGTMELSGDGRLYLSSNLPRLYLRENDTTDKDILVLLNSGTFSVQQRNDDESFNKILMKIETSGTVGDMLVLDSTEAVINQNGSDYDFRVEGDTETHLLICDASLNHVGIGVGIPSFKFDVNDNVSSFVQRVFNDGNANNRNGILIQAGADNNPSCEFMRFMSGNQSQDVGSIDGTGAGGTAYNTSSDIRFKENIKPLKGNLNLLRINPITYTGIGGNVRAVGVSAQEVKKVLPELVRENNGRLSLDYGRAALIFALDGFKQNDKRIKKLESEIRKLKKRLGE